MPDDPLTMDPRSVETLLTIMRALRSPKTGCPWDLEQSFATIAPYTIEEAYEVADAIERGDKANLKEELGDLLLQPVYHAQMAAEEGSFDFADVVQGVCEKMIRRHPHVFGPKAARNAPLAKGFWENAKAKEKAADAGVLDGIPVGLPGLTRAVKLQKKAAHVGFDWPHVDYVYEKMAEELAELRAAPESSRVEEMGDLLFVIANLARHYDIDPETALRSANAKFERRFKFIESELSVTGKTPAQSDLTEMDALWDKAKTMGL